MWIGDKETEVLTFERLIFALRDVADHIHRHNSTDDHVAWEANYAAGTALDKLAEHLEKRKAD